MDKVEERSEMLTSVRIELRELKKDVSELVASAHDRDVDEKQRQLQQVRDRKADRKWQLTVMAAWASAIIAAIAIIVPLLVQG